MKFKNKKDGGLIRNWQLHHITIPEGQEEGFEALYPEAIIPPIVFTGTVVHDAAGRFRPGYHIRSTYICSMDKTLGQIETLNTIYKVIDEGGDIFPDLGNDVFSIVY